MRVSRVIAGAGANAISKAYQAKAALRYAGKTTARTVARTARATVKAIKPATKKSIDMIRNTLKVAAAKRTAKLEGTKYFKKKYAKEISIAKKAARKTGIKVNTDAVKKTARAYAAKRLRHQAENKAVLVGGSVVLLGYGVSEAGKKIKSNVNEIIDKDGD